MMPSAPRPAALRPLAALGALLLAGLLFGNCAGDKSPTGGPDDTSKVDTTKGPTETVTLFGRIEDDTGGALQGVIITVPSEAGKADTTDANGYFSISKAKVPKGRAVVMAKKAGYYPGSRAAAPGGDGIARLHLRMMKRTVHTVSGSAGGKVDVKGGVALDFPAGSFVTSSGTAYTGTVNVYADYLNPDSATFYDFFSGDNAGRTAEGRTTGLISAGVLRVELASTSGAALKLASGKEAVLSYPKPSSGETPESIPLWYFDEADGIWKEEGAAVLKDGAYQGSVKHFTDWNLDFKGDYGTIVVTVRCQAIPLEGVVVSVGQVKGISDRNGVVRFTRAPAIGQATRIQILSGNNDGRFFKTDPVDITAKKDDEVSSEIKLDSPCPAILYGKLTGCDDKPLEGLVSASWDNGASLDLDYTLDGNWKVFPPVGKALLVNASDVAGNKMIPPRNSPALGAGQEQDLGTLKVCGAATSDFYDLKHDSVDLLDEFELSDDGKFLAAVGGGKVLVVWDLKTRKVHKEITLPTFLGSGDMSISGDNKRLLLGRYPETFGYVVDIEGGKVQSTVSGIVWGMITQDGGTVVGASPANPKTLVLYNAQDGQQAKVLSLTDFQAPDEWWGVHPVHLVPGEDAVVYLTTLPDATFRVWSLKDDAPIRDIPLGRKRPVSLFDSLRLDADFSKDGTRMGVTHDWETLDIYDVLQGKKMASFDPKKHGVDPSPNSSLQVTLGTTMVFAREKISGVPAFLQFDYKNDALVKLLPIPKGDPRVAFPQLSVDESVVMAENGDSLRVWPLK